MKVTTLEQSILNWIRLNCDDDQVAEQLRCVQILDRKYTGIGFFLTLAVPDDAPIAAKCVNDINPILGPDIRDPNSDSWAQTALYVNDGRVETLEIFSNTSSHLPASLDLFILVT